MYVRKNLLSQVSLCDTLKINELSKGKEVSETDRKLTKICQKFPKGGALHNFRKYTKCHKHDKQEISNENTQNKII